MENSNNLNQSTNKEKINIKLVTIILSAILFIGLVFSFTSLSYKSFLSNFKEYFDNAHYKTATNHVVTKGNMNILKAVKLDSDLSSYFKDKLNNVASDINEGKLTSDEALIIINEVNRYNLLDAEIDKAVAVLSQNTSNITSSDSKSTSNVLTKGITEFEQEKFKEALTTFKSIPSTHEGYETALNYIPKCKESYTKALFKEVDTLISENYYSKSIELLETNLDVLDNSTVLTEKIEKLKIEREEYIKIRDKK